MLPYLLRICQKQQEKEAERLRKEADEEKAAREAFELQKRRGQETDRCSTLQYCIPTFKAAVCDKAEFCGS